MWPFNRTETERLRIDVAILKDRMRLMEKSLKMLDCSHPVEKRNIYLYSRACVEICELCEKPLNVYDQSEYKLRLAELRFKQWSALKDESAGNSE